MKRWIPILVLTTTIALHAQIAGAKEEVSSMEPDNRAWEINASYPTKIIINIPERILTLFHGEQQIFEFPVAVGSPAFKTPVGERALSQIVWNPWWMPPDSEWAKDEKPTPPGPGNPLGPVKMELGKTILLHGTNKESTVGRPASHGCMRMLNQHARQLAWWIQSNFTEQSDPMMLEGYRLKSGRSFYVNLPTPIPVDIRYEVFEMENGFLKVHPDVYSRLGDRKKKMIQWLDGHGYSEGDISEETLNTVLEGSKSKTVMVSLNELVPGRFEYAKKKAPEMAQTSSDAGQKVDTVLFKGQKIRVSAATKYR